MADYPVKIVHLSDLHFGNEDTDKLNALLGDLSRDKPDMILVTGDILAPLHRRGLGSRAKMSAKHFFSKLERASKVYAVPGNHDPKRFERCFQRKPEFCDFLTIKGVDFSIFGLNSTSIWHPTRGEIRLVQLNNTFASFVDSLWNGPGEFKYEGSIKVVLLHHHPITTLSDELEEFLYLKNAGKFLNKMAESKVNLILHGHKHEPCHFSLNYNVGGDEDLITILSAGTALEKIKNERSFSKKTHYYFIEVYENFLRVESRNYDAEHKTFWPTGSFNNRLYVDPFKDYKLNSKFFIRPGGDLYAECEKTILAKPGKEIKKTTLIFGVDENTPGCSYADVKLSVQRNGQNLGSPLIQNLEEKESARYKEVVVTLEPPVNNKQPCKISWQYKWPKGWTRLLNDGVDVGVFTASRALSEYSVGLCLETHHKFRDFIVRSKPLSSANDMGTSFDGKNCWFCVKNVKKNSIISMRVHIKVE